MPQPALAVAHSQNRESDWETFRRLLTHDDRNSFYVLATDAGGQWRETAVKNNGLLAVGFQPNASYYITHNGFTSRTRKTEALRQLNALFFDLDCHNAAEAETRAAVEEAIQAISSATKAGNLPEPTMIIDSGRGLQLFYVLDRSIPMNCSNKGATENKGAILFSAVQQQLASAIEAIIKDIPNISLDRATFDHARVSRIPGTYNRNARRFARLVEASEIFHSLQALRTSLCAFSAQSIAKPLPRRAKTHASLMHYKPLMLRRLTKIVDLQAYRNFNCEGNRELMCFVFYNTAVQIYDQDHAVQRLSQFNARFIKPLANTELKGIISSVDGVVNLKGDRGYYLIGVVRLIEMLGLTEEEVQAIDFFESSKALQRKQAKQQTRAKRQARNNEIIKLRQTTNLTQKEIAQRVGCSLRTVASVLKNYSISVAVNVINHCQAEQAKEPTQTCNFLPYESMECSALASLALRPLAGGQASSLTETLSSRNPVKEGPSVSRAFSNSLVLHSFDISDHLFDFSDKLEISFPRGLLGVFQGVFSCFQIPINVFLGLFPLGGIDTLFGDGFNYG